MKILLKKIFQLYTKNHLAVKAEKRLIRDLEAIAVRLEKKEYETSGLTENILNIREKNSQLTTLLQTYSEIGEAWSYILNRLNIDEQKEIIDLCPGSAPKIELALFYCQYKGKVILIEKDRQVAESLVKLAGILRPQFKIEIKSDDFFHLGEREFSFVIGNHLIDDLIINYFAAKKGAIFNELYEYEGKLKSMWEAILEKDESNCREITAKLIGIFSRIIKKKGYLCLAQYKSFFEKVLDLDKSFVFTMNVYNQMIKGLCKNGFKKTNIDPEEFKLKKSYFRLNDSVILVKE